MEDKWYLITWQDDSPYKVVSRFFEEYDPDSMIVVLEDPYGKVSMCQMSKKNYDDMLEWERPDKDTNMAIDRDQALSDYGYCARYLPYDEILPKKGFATGEKDFKLTKEQHIRYRRAVQNGWYVPSWTAWKCIVAL